MNATAIGRSARDLIADVGNDVSIYAFTATYNIEGDLTTAATYTLTGTSKWVEPDRVDIMEYSQFGVYDLKENEAIIGNDIAVTLRGKCVSNSISWEIVGIRPLRIKDTTVLNILTLKEKLP